MQPYSNCGLYAKKYNLSVQFLLTSAVAEFARMKKENRRTLSSRRDRVLEKLRLFFEDRGFDVHK